MSTLTVKELAAPTGYDLKIASGETLDLKSQGTVTMPTGSVLQVVQADGFSNWSTSSTTWSTTGLTAAITPSSTSSKILVTVQITFSFSTATRPRGGFRLHKDDDTVVVQTSDEGFHVHSLGSGGEYRAHMAFSYLDSPNSTSSQDYWVEGRTDSGANTTSITGHDGSTWINPSSITLMEIAG